MGDPINAVRIFNEKEVDELVLLDIEASVKGVKPNFDLISDIASECFMPFCYGGGIKNLDDIQRILHIGAEKVSINSLAIENPQFVTEASERFGSQSIVVSLDIKKNLFRKYEIYTKNGTFNTHLDPVQVAQNMEAAGAGELFINSIDRDGTMKGYDLELLHLITSKVNIPVIACGGAGKIDDFKQAVEVGGVSAVAAGSFFVFHGKHRAVLITFPTPGELAKVLA